jgi:UDP-glucose 4-epimerase
MRNGLSPVLYGDGTQRRDFTYQGDVVTCFVNAMKSLQSDKTIPRIINVGTGVNYSLNDLVDLLNEKLGSDIKPTYKDVKIPGYVDATLADCTLMKLHLGKDEVSLGDGISRVLSALKARES